MNKAQLVDALTTRLGDRRAATAAVDAMVEVIVETVGSGGSVTLTGFGVFEARRRAPRTARNPRTGETVPVGETIVPSFRPGAAFKERVATSEAAAAGATSAPRRAPRERTASAPLGSADAQRSTGTGGRAKRAAPKKAATTKSDATAKKQAATVKKQAAAVAKPVTASDATATKTRAKKRTS